MLRAFVLIFTVSLLAPAPLAAQDEPSTESDGYRAIIESAVSEFAAQNFAEARALFRRAHAIRPNARTLRGLGMSAFELRDYADSVRRLRESLDDTRHALTDEQRAQVTVLLQRAEAFVARYELALPDGAVLSVDGVPASLEPDGTLLLALGTHALVVRREGAVLGEARIDVEGGETGPLALDLVEPPTTAIETLPLSVPVRDEPTPTPSRDLGGPIALVVTGGIVAAVGAVLVGVGVADSDSVASAPDRTPWSTLEGAYTRGPVLQGAGGAALGVGLAAAIGGVIWLAVGTDEVRVSATASGLLVQGTF